MQTLSLSLVLLVALSTSQELLVAESFKVSPGGGFSVTASQSFSGNFRGRQAIAHIQENHTAGPGYRRASSSLSVSFPDLSSTSKEELSFQSSSMGPLQAASAPSETTEEDETTKEVAGSAVTRKDLVASVAAELQVPRAEVEKTVSAFLRHISASLEQGQKVSLSKFGSLGLRRRGERVARNPRTGEQLTVPATTFPTFSFSKVLKDKVREVIPAHEADEEDADETKKKGLFGWN
ncbi:histone family DNA-binding protein [Toxoplasma gondii RUB]|uniref:Histone family DNA-binding protein n=1 Tax=Toxoplasma gondii RUB TaxID=935652 RepID=A0A086M9S7_TOXGO|nr:histone family DNA-binding protein [Toxoplasma gondii RUB]